MMMIKMTGARVRLLAGAALLLASGLSHAQYAWIDEKGVRQFSDRPPPPSTPVARIIKAPGLRALAAAEAAVPDAAVAKADAAKASVPQTLAERDAAFRKRAGERAERDQKTAEETKRTAAQAENCSAARDYRQQLDSGVRISVTAKGGEQGFMDDAGRAASRAKVDKILEACR